MGTPITQNCCHLRITGGWNPEGTSPVSSALSARNGSQEVSSFDITLIHQSWGKMMQDFLGNFYTGIIELYNPFWVESNNAMQYGCFQK